LVYIFDRITSNLNSMKTAASQTRAKLFDNGRSQAVRLPKEFRMPGKEVLIRHEGNLVVLEPIAEELDAKGWPVGFWGAARELAEQVKGEDWALFDAEVSNDPPPPPLELDDAGRTRP